MVCFRDLLAVVNTHRAFILFLALSAILFLTNIGAYGQFLRAESNFALGARMMLETKELLLPHAPHELPLNKPPLQYWLIGISYKILGFSHGAGRLPSALCGLGVLSLVYILGVRLRDQTLGLTASAMLATSYIFWSFSRLAMPDMLLTLCVTVALVCWMLVLAERTGRPGALVRIGYAAVALGFLAKGPVALALSLLPVLAASVVTRDAAVLRRLRPVSGAGVFLLLAVPYFVLVYVQDGPEPLRNFFINENVRRFTGTTYLSEQPILLYEVTAFLADFAPWSLFFILTAFSYAGWGRTGQAPLRQRHVLVAWLLAPIALFAVSRFKLDYYFLPGLPPAALIVAESLLPAAPLSSWGRRAGLFVLFLLASLLAIAVVLTIQIVEVNFYDIRLRWLPHVVAVTTLLPAGVFALRGLTYRAVLAFAFSLGAATVTAYLVLLPGYARFLPASALAQSVPPASAVYVSARAGDWASDLALHLPTSQPVRTLAGDRDGSQLRQVLQADPPAPALIYEGDHGELQTAGLQVHVLAQAEANNGPRLTLKSLLHPSRERLYIVSR